MGAQVWAGTTPSTCEVCNQPITDRFVDGRTKMGPWAIMCPGCHKHHGYGLGTGKGQEYTKETATNDGHGPAKVVWVKRQ